MHKNGTVDQNMCKLCSRWLNLKEACKYARMSRNTLLKHIREGDIYGTKRPGFWIVDQESIDAFYMEDEAISVDLMRRVGLKCGS